MLSYVRVEQPEDEQVKKEYRIRETFFVPGDDGDPVKDRFIFVIEDVGMSTGKIISAYRNDVSIKAYYTDYPILKECGVKMELELPKDYGLLNTERHQE